MAVCNVNVKQVSDLIYSVLTLQLLPLLFLLKGLYLVYHNISRSRWLEFVADLMRALIG